MRGSTPTRRTAPTEQTPTDSEHDIHESDFVDADWDGFGIDEAESVDGEPLVALHESAECARDGCDAAHTRRILFTTEALSDDEKRALDAVSGPDDPRDYVWEHGERVGPRTIEVDGTKITAERTIENEPLGPCYGHEEPDPEPQWRDV